MQFVDLGIMDFKEHLNTVSTRQRSQFLERCFGTSCGFAATLLLATQTARRACGQELPGDVVGKRLFGRIEKIADGVWRWCPLRLLPAARQAISVLTTTMV